ncbi:hypothetical protein MHYP_G00088190 [Metynnis hypsauchen]
MASTPAHTTSVKTRIIARTGRKGRVLNLEMVLDEFDLRKYEQLEERLPQLLPKIEASRKVVLGDCNLSEEGCAALTSALRNSSILRELEFNNTGWQDVDIKLLSAALENSHCKLEKLRLYKCNFTEESCAVVASALSSDTTSLREMDLSETKLQDSGAMLLSAELKNPNCKLETLKLERCDITEEGCADLFRALKLNPSSHLRELNLSGNTPGESGVKELCDLLNDPSCKLEELRLDLCDITEEGCADLFRALKLNPSSHLRELNLSGNTPGESGVKELCDLLNDPSCKLEELRLDLCDITEEGCADLFRALKLNPSSHLRELNLGGNTPGESGVKELCDLLNDPSCKLEKLQLYLCYITEKACADLFRALKLNPSSHLRELNLSDNTPGESGVKELCDLLNDPSCKLEELRLSCCSITEEAGAALASALKSNRSSQLRKLNLWGNKLGESAKKELTAVYKDPLCKLQCLLIL